MITSNIGDSRSVTEIENRRNGVIGVYDRRDNVHLNSLIKQIIDIVKPLPVQFSDRR